MLATNFRFGIAGFGRFSDLDAPPYRGLCLMVFLENVYGYLDI